MYLRCSLRNLWAGFIPALFLLSLPALSQSFSDNYWKKILWYEGSSGLVSDNKFYLAENGKTYPEAELKESLRLFKTDSKFGKLQLPAKCAYPLRWKYLNQIEPLPSPQTGCEEFEAWKRDLGVTKVSLIFAGYYPNNPASIFGHTFLKLHGPQKERLLDYGVNFAAITGEETGLIFGLKGLFGSYEGFFNLAPYFLKVNEYTNTEGRDLFEYELNLNPEEIEILLDGLWEIANNGSFDYFFLSKNCSYFLLRLLDIARLNSTMAEDFSHIAIPSETLKGVVENGMTEKVVMRSSLDRELVQIHQELGPDHLWTKIKVAQFKKQTLKDWSEGENENLHHLLTEQSSQQVPKISPVIMTDHPAQTHGPFRIELGVSEVNQEFGTNLMIKPAVHDLVDPPTGHLPYSKMDLLALSMRSEKLDQWSLQKFSLIETSAFTPWRTWSRRFSWRGELTHFQEEWSVKGRRLDQFLSGAGLTYELAPGVITSLLLTAHLDLSNHFREGWSLNLDPEWTVLASFDQWSYFQKWRLAQRWERGEDQKFYEITEEARYSLGKRDWVRAEFTFYHEWGDTKLDQSRWSLGWVRAF